MDYRFFGLVVMAFIAVFVLIASIPNQVGRQELIPGFQE